MQSKKASLIESIVNIIFGYSIALLSQLIIFPVFNIHVGIQENILIGLWFTVVSIVRSYVLRRVFNRFSDLGISYSEIKRSRKKMNKIIKYLGMDEAK